MTFTIPEWVLWLFGVPIGIIFVGFAFIGAYLYFSWDKR